MGLTELKPFWSSNGKRPFKRPLPSMVEYRKGTLHDLKTLRFESGLSVSAESIEFNVLGMGHEFWIGVQAGAIVALGVLAEENTDSFRILHLEVAPSRKKEGVGTALMRAIMKAYPRYSLSVVPFDGTEDFYQRLGFAKVSRWEMRRGNE